MNGVGSSGKINCVGLMGSSNSSFLPGSEIGIHQRLLPDLIQEIQELALEMHKTNGKVVNSQEKERILVDDLSELGFTLTEDVTQEPISSVTQAENDEFVSIVQQKGMESAYHHCVDKPAIPISDQMVINTEVEVSHKSPNAVELLTEKEVILTGMSTLDTQGSRSQNADSTDILKTKEAGKKGEGTCQELSNANIQTQKAIIGEEQAVLKPSIEAAKMTITNEARQINKLQVISRQSSRIQDDGTTVLSKTMAKKAESLKGALWTIWKTRNDVVFNKVMSSPKVIICKTQC